MLEIANLCIYLLIGDIVRIVRTVPHRTSSRFVRTVEIGGKRFRLGSPLRKCLLCDALSVFYVHDKHFAMGILGLSKLIADVAPEAIKERELKHYFGK